MNIRSFDRLVTPAPVDDPPIDPILAKTAPQAFEAVRSEILAVPASMFLPINLDVPRAAGRGILAAERIAPLLPSLTKLPEFQIRPVENLPTYSLALLHCHELTTEEGASPQPELAILWAEAVPLREGMLRTAELLAHFGIVSAERVAAIRSGRGYADAADGLLALGRLFRELWARIHDKVVVTREMVDRAITLGGLMRKALAAREVEANPLVQPTDPRYLRLQAFALFARAYQECRRGVTFLRWYHGDVQQIVPTLYPRKNPSPRTTSEEIQAEPDDASPGVTDPSHEEDPAAALDDLVAES